MARNAARTNELAVRAALGGSRGRLVGQLVLEVAITVVVAAVIGLSAARYGLTVFEARVTDLPLWVVFSLDPRVIAFTALLAGLATSVAGLGPALRATSGDVHDILKDGGRAGSALRFGRMTDAIVIVELAVSVGFLAAAAILAESLLSFSFARYELPGNETLVANLYFGQPAEFSDPDVQLGDGERQRIWREFTGHARQSQQEILDGALGLPGVDAVTIASRFPGDESVRSRVEIEHATSSDPVMAEIAHVGEGYFDLLGVGITRGRDFLATEREGSFVAMVDEPFVQKHLHGASALGRRFRLVRDEGEPGAWLEIVGVIPDIGLAVGDPSRSGSVYRPIEATNIFWLAMRGDGEPERWIPALTEMVREVDETVRVQGPQSLERLMMLPVLLYRGIGFGFLILGGVALLLSAVSLHAITACSVARRTRELGIRRALGAGTANMVSATVRRAAVQMGAGLLLGSGIGFGLLSLASILPWRLGAGHSLFIALVPAVLALSILVALWRPLSRALAIRPADALRYE
jgi:hypothetical protein